MEKIKNHTFYRTLSFVTASIAAKMKINAYTISYLSRFIAR